MSKRGGIGTFLEQVSAAGTTNYRGAVARAAEQASRLLECNWRCQFFNSPLRAMVSQRRWMSPLAAGAKSDLGLLDAHASLQ